MARILLAEDQSELSRMMASSLRLEGHQVEAKTDGEAALGSLLEKEFDLAILDIHLPQMSAIEICDELGVRGKSKNLHILIISADANPFQIEKCLELGAETFLGKPFSVAELLKNVDSLLAKQPIKSS